MFGPSATVITEALARDYAASLIPGCDVLAIAPATTGGDALDVTFTECGRVSILTVWIEGGRVYGEY